MPNMNASNLFDKRKQSNYLAGNMAEDDGFVTTTASPVAGDKIRICRIPAGSRVTEVYLANTDLDSGTTVTFSLGHESEDGAVSAPAAFIAAGATQFQSAGSSLNHFVGDQAVTVERDSFLVATLGGTFAGWAAGGTVRARVRWQARGTTQ